MKKIEIKNERLAAAVRTNDAGLAFKTAVENGQTRLALDILESIFPNIIERLDEIETKLENMEAVAGSEPVTTKAGAVDSDAKAAPKANKEPKVSKDSVAVED